MCGDHRAGSHQFTPDSASINCANAATRRGTFADIGSTVMCLLGAANRDPAAYDDPERLAARVVVDGRDPAQRASSASRRAFTPGHSPASTL